MTNTKSKRKMRAAGVLGSLVLFVCSLSGCSFTRNYRVTNGSGLSNDLVWFERKVDTINRVRKTTQIKGTLNVHFKTPDGKPIEGLKVNQTQTDSEGLIKIRVDYTRPVTGISSHEIATLRISPSWRSLLKRRAPKVDIPDIDTIRYYAVRKGKEVFFRVKVSPPTKTVQDPANVILNIERRIDLAAKKRIEEEEVVKLRRISENTGNPNLNYVNRLKNQQALADKKRTAENKKSLYVSENGKASLDDLAAKISKRCKLPKSHLEVNNWNETRGLSVTVLSTCPRLINQVIKALRAILQEKELNSVGEVAFLGPFGKFRTFAVIQITTSTGYVEYENSTRRAITTTYIFSTKTLDAYLHGEISENKFQDGIKKVVLRPR